LCKTDEENIAIARPYVERAAKCGVAVEVELGRLEGGEAGLRTISDAKLTDPAKASAFIDGFVPRLCVVRSLTAFLAPAL
jgi:fructose-bisphosphate aldolase class II